MATFPRGPAPTLILLISALASAGGFAADPAQSQPERKGRATVKSDAKPPAITREYLLAHGFKQSAKDPDSFYAEKVRLGDIASALGFETSAIDHWINNSPRRDDGTVIVQKKLVVLHSEVHFGRNSARNELDRASTICSVTILLKIVRAAEAGGVSALRTAIRRKMSVRDAAEGPAGADNAGL